MSEATELVQRCQTVEGRRWLLKFHGDDLPRASFALACARLRVSGLYQQIVPTAQDVYVAQLLLARDATGHHVLRDADALAAELRLEGWRVA